ncbi:MAG: phosphoribosylformylglycinamidine synthase subunit PurQ [Rubrimonas sp.]|uniref:phosphoribosylformylglycinamidine synthase subunit PurQ n=1 Tax=Rubrimonas sp. TaxID=2036015 RepID=UPI002FDEFD5B
MRAAVLVFPGSNCDRDMEVALRAAGADVVRLWHKEASLPAGLDLVAIPGGFSFGDYLRCGAIAARAPAMTAVAGFLRGGGYGLGVCNGFQVLLEAGLLPGALMRNRGLTFLRRDVSLRIETADSAFTRGYAMGAEISLPIAHHDGCYVAEPETLARLDAEDRVALRYLPPNPNGSMDDIAGVLSENRRVLGLMPHPERAADPALGGADARADGAPLFAGLVGALVGA